MNTNRKIEFSTTLSKADLSEALGKIMIIATTVELFDMAAIQIDDTVATAKIMSKDGSLLIVVTSEYVNREVTAALGAIGGLGNGRYNPRNSRLTYGLPPGEAHSVSSKTKFAAAMRYLGADKSVVSTFRKATAATLLQITDNSDTEEVGVTRVEVMRKEETVRAEWKAAVEGVDLNVEIRVVAIAKVDRGDSMSYQMEFHYDPAAAIDRFRSTLKAAGLSPFDGDIN